LLDGRNRWRAAEVAGVTITAKDIQQFDPKTDGDPLAWVISKNLQRRHLDESQRAWVGSKIANLPPHRPADDKSANLRTSQTDAATMLNVSKRSIQSAIVVRDHGSPELQHEVEQGHLSVSLGAKAATMPTEDQAEVAARAGNGEINVVRKVIKQMAHGKIERKSKLSHKIIDVENSRFIVCERYARK
jgi:hypothetical protein